jgi:YHS domain-containing protein
MKYILVLFSFFSFGSFIASCNNQVQADKEESPAIAANVDTVRFTAAMVDNKKDPSCGMPISAGVEDTVHYNNKILGFCSKECKDDFLKNPAKNIAAADLKK